MSNSKLHFGMDRVHFSLYIMSLSLFYFLFFLNQWAGAHFRVSHKVLDFADTALLLHRLPVARRSSAPRRPSMLSHAKPSPAAPPPHAALPLHATPPRCRLRQIAAGVVELQWRLGISGVARI